MDKKDFMKLYAVHQHSGCWIWAGKLSGPYGVAEKDGKQIPAHRLSYELHIGELQPDMVVDHLCMNKRCVNPHHLKQITKGENTSRKREALKRKILRENNGVFSDSLHHITIEGKTMSKNKKPSDPIKRAEDIIERTNRIKSWETRFQSLKFYKGKTIASFCSENGLDNTHICHIIKGRRGANWETINKVENSLRKEGV